MKKKALLLLPLALMGIASCDIPNQWQNDAQSIYIHDTYYLNRVTVREFHEFEGKHFNEDYYLVRKISYHLENNAIYVKEMEKRYKEWDYDEETKVYSNPRSLSYDKTFVYNFAGLPYEITYKEGVAL